MIPNNGFNGAHKWNLGGPGREKSARGAIRHNGVNVAAQRRTIYVGRYIKGARGSSPLRRLETVWSAGFGGRRRFKTQMGLFQGRIVAAGFRPASIECLIRV